MSLFILVQVSLLLLNLAYHNLCSPWLYWNSASISFMCRSNCFNYTAHSRATINAINRSNIRVLNYNHINNDLAHVYSATTTQQSDGCPCHS